jgi:3'-5' exoribonuclease
MKQLIADLKKGDRVNSLFLVHEKSWLSFKNREGRYMHLLLQDRSGEIEAQIWDNAEKYRDICKTGVVMSVSGEVTGYRDKLQINVDGLRKTDPGEVDSNLFIPESFRNTEEMKIELIDLLGSIESGPLKELADEFVNSPYFKVYCFAPAAKMYHHNVVGGLLEHSLGTAQICLKIAELHSEMDRDLIILGAALHDVGKIDEMEIDGGINYTDEGKLLGHIILGIQLLEKLMENISIDNSTRNKLLHMITSHHGEYEWQSPKKPQFLEAKVLHLADMMDAEIWKFKNAQPSSEGSNWSSYMKSIGSEVYLVDRA